MWLRRLNVLLLIACLGCLAINWQLERDWSQPNDIILPGMSEPVSYSAFAANPHFRDGKTLQEPIRGTIPRGHLPMYYNATPEDAVRAGLELQNPLDPSDELVQQRGAFVFANYCQVCHGPKGEGNGPAAQRGVPPPPSMLTGKSKDMKDGQLFHILTYGQANMASYAGQLSREDRWRVIVHVRSLQQAAPAQAAPATGEKQP